MTKVANAFKDGDAVTIKATASKPNGDPMPQCGKRGLIVGTPSKGRHLVDVPGMPVANLSADDLAPAAQAALAPNAAAPAAASGAMHADKRAVPGTVTYAFDVLALTLIVPSLTNPRSHFDPEALQSLSENIKADGLLQPILVRPLPGSRLEETFNDRRSTDPRPTHEIVAGERRYRACGMAGVRSVPVLVRNLTDEQVLRMQLVENVQREDLHPLEEAQGYRRILDLPSQAERPMADRVADMASAVKKSTRYIYQTMQLLQLCNFAQKVFLEKKLDRTTALQVATIGNEAGQIEATRHIAGLARTGTNADVVDRTLSQREAAEYVRNTHRLELKDAPFNIKITLADAPACGECPKMSGNASDLFDEGKKAPDTCLDRSCYGKKSNAHHTALAEAAKAKGQTVISGAAAKKIVPYSHRPTYLQGGYTAISERQYGDGLDGKTVKQLLGKNMPGTTLIDNPHGPGFIEALLTADVKRLFKEHGIGNSKDVGRDDYAVKQSEQNKKDKAEREFRQTWATQLLDKAGALDQADLFERLLTPMAARLYQRLDHDNTKRLHAMLGWPFAYFGYDEHDKAIKHFKGLSEADFNKFIIAACITGELHVAQYCTPRTSNLDEMSALLGVDGKAIKAKLQSAARAAVKAKADKAKSKAAPAAKKTTKAVTAAPDATASEFAIGDRVRFRQGLKGPAGHFRKCCGKAGVIDSVSCGQYTVQIDGVKDLAVAEFDEIDAEPAAGKKAGSKKSDPTANQTSLDIPASTKVDAWPLPREARP
ncbi:ParB/RepB/Spo0J family partition protein [Polaromonas sp.]|uniref:ParB/RepB/Spo0J family partition protein n=1 Tax=Polaromonas sp. TaxID=1869339 RepID=UPI00356B5774